MKGQVNEKVFPSTPLPFLVFETLARSNHVSHSMSFRVKAWSLLQPQPGRVGGGGGVGHASCIILSISYLNAQQNSNILDFFSSSLLLLFQWRESITGKKLVLRKLSV